MRDFEKVDINKLHEMELHSTIHIDEYVEVMRVSGGWNYIYNMVWDYQGDREKINTNVVFVPNPLEILE